MKLEQIKDVLSSINLGPSKWELDNITWHDRVSDPKTLAAFLDRIQELKSIKKPTADVQQELGYLLELWEEVEQSDIDELCSRTDEDAKNAFIEELAKVSAIEVITDGKISYETMNTACKLSPNDFILCAKRTQDLLNSIQNLVVKGETLSKDVAGA